MNKLIFVIGPEGAGHHMISEMINLPKLDAHIPHFIRYWNNEVSDNLDFFLNDAIMKAQHKKEDWLLTASFPYDNPRDSLRRPDILEFVNRAKKYLDIKILPLYRNPEDAAWSLVRRGWFKTTDLRIRNQILYQAKIVEDNYLYIKAHLEALGTFPVLVYEDVIENPKKYCKLLEDYLGVPIKRSGIKEPTPEEKPVNAQRILSRFFSNKRLELFQPYFLENALTSSTMD